MDMTILGHLLAFGKSIVICVSDENQCLTSIVRENTAFLTFIFRTRSQTFQNIVRNTGSELEQPHYEEDGGPTLN